jgi:hypothetical protein
MNKRLSFLERATHKGLFGQFAQTACGRLRQFWYQTHSSTSWSSEDKPAQYKHLASASSSFLCPIRLLLRTPRNDVPRFTAKLVVSLHLLLSLSRVWYAYIFHWKGVLFSFFSFCCLLCVSQRDSGQFSLFPVSVDFTPLFSSDSALYGEVVLSFSAVSLFVDLQINPFRLSQSHSATESVFYFILKLF